MTDITSLTYNSQKEDLIISEYGRNIQKLVNYAKTIEDEEEKQAFAERIVRLMKQVNGQIGPIEEQNARYWRHLFKISDYKLHVTPPNDLDIDDKEYKTPFQKVAYPTAIKSFRHYGNNIRHMIQKAISEPDQEKKEEFTNIIASYMKLAFAVWNRGHNVSDEKIKGDLFKLSNGELECNGDPIDFYDSSLAKTRADSYPPKRSKPTRKKSYGSKRNSRGSSSSSSSSHKYKKTRHKRYK